MKIQTYFWSTIFFVVFNVVNSFFAKKGRKVSKELFFLLEFVGLDIFAV